MRKILALSLTLAFLVPAAALAEPYIAKEQVDFAQLLAAPPALDSDGEQRELAEVMLARANASPAERQRAFDDGAISIFRFADVLGPRFKEGRRLAKVMAFFDHISRDTRPLTSAAKIQRHRDRPFVIDPNVQAPTQMIKEVCNDAGTPGSTYPACPNGVNYSYPSGHSTYGTYVALLLAEMVPEKRDQLLARGREYGYSRVINGVHFPTDVEAGRIAATVMVVLMLQNPHFRADLAEAKAELRRVLGLPPAR